MSRFVPYLAEEAIERDAASLIGEYEHARGVTVEPPIPVVDIVEKFLKLRIEFDDLHARYGVPRPASGETNILGAIYGDGSIFIDESLDPEENPSNEGRYRFTVAHEGGGHWRLHQALIRADRGQSSMGDDDKLLCRSSEAKKREEWQADFYASCLLMPRRLMRTEWERRFSSHKPFIFAAYRQNPRWNPPKAMWTPLYDAARHAVRRSVGLDPEQSHDFAFDTIALELAEVFNVSRQAMRIRLEHLKLLLRDHPAQGSFRDAR